MKRKIILLAAMALCLAEFPVQPQPGPPGGGPRGRLGGPSLTGAMTKLFSENPAFSAALELATKDPGTSEPITMPAQLSFLDGKVRFDLDMSRIKSARMSPNMAAQMKAMGMSEMSAISRPDKKLTYMVYPVLSSYAEQPFPAEEAADADAKFSMEVTEMGKETVDGHPCVKNKVVASGNNGKKHEFTVCNASDLKKFPVRIEFNEGGQTGTMTFKDVKFAKPEASLFEPPKAFTRYESIQAMMQGAMMKMMGGGAGPK